MKLSPRDFTSDPVSADDLTAFGLADSVVFELAKRINACLAEDSATDRWQKLTHVLTPDIPFELHRWLFDSVYFRHDFSQGPPPAWLPTRDQIAAANVTKFAKQQGLNGFKELRTWAIENHAAFWQAVFDTLQISAENPDEFRDNLADESTSSANGWLAVPDFNIVDSCFQAPADRVAIMTRNESGEDQQVTYRELERLVNRVANGLRDSGFEVGDRIGVMLPMTVESVAAYLGTIRAGCVPVSIAESFAAKEISVRMSLADAKGIFLTDVIHRAGKTLPCFEKFSATNLDAHMILIPARNMVAGSVAGLDKVTLWDDFLSDDESFASVVSSANGHTNILFSSGTTGEPKAIPWTQTTPVKCAADGRFHHNIHSNSVAAWPTSLGWMMGPWLIFASLINRATVALFDGAANSRLFCQFVQDAKVTMLGVIPSLVRAWRSGGMIDGLDWSTIQAFSSTGECSNADDMLYLMSRAGYRPVIEYCGGTEIGGGYITSTVVEPNVPGCFTTAALGLDFVLLDDGKPADQGEVFLVGPSIGLSQSLLNADHDAVYFQGTPRIDGLPPLRRHGDELIRFADDCYQACGRTDDAMNLGGIKISAVELERCLNRLPAVTETAAIAVPDEAGGPSALVVFAVVPDESESDTEQLRAEMQQLISRELNPLFRIAKVIPVASLPRTASNKVMRRKLRGMVG